MDKLFSNIFCIRIIAVWTFFALTFSVFAPFSLKAQQNRQLSQDNNETQKRIALVIGNSAYTKAKVLPNPANDAADMAKTLKDLDFEVLSGTNLNKRQTETLIREFGRKLAASGSKRVC
ncbi:MAG: caspase family protein [Pyrinomonadaceae bacterium]